MSTATTTLLGFIAGVTILIGLPVGRLQNPRPGLRVFLNACAIGVLLFLVWDVLSAAWVPIDAGLAQFHNDGGGLPSVFGYGALFALGLSAGMLSLVWYETWMVRRVRGAVSARPSGPGAMSATEQSRLAAETMSPARRLAFLIAVGIGLHNFAEGLAIGQSAASGELSLAVMLVIGFGLHNATEGFGIVGPLAGDVDASGRLRRPSWGLLLLLGAIAGGPTLVGTIVGHGFTSEPVSVVFLTLAAGSILYVVTQLLGVAAKMRRPTLVGYGLVIGLLAGFLTDAIVTAAGA
ncbi:MAG: zinc transporter, family [Nocardioidaceae bacterium]|jgi:ZIP family zinc transporter|nr:zinc transporter, family [Nocardioidaceae bacterium]